MQLMTLEGYYPVVMGLGALKKIKKVAKVAGKTALNVAKTTLPAVAPLIPIPGAGVVSNIVSNVTKNIPASNISNIVKTAQNTAKNIIDKNIQKVNDTIQKNIITAEATAQNIKNAIENIKNIADKDTINILETALKKQEEKKIKLSEAKKKLEKTIYVKFLNDLNVNINLINNKVLNKKQNTNNTNILELKKKIDEAIK